MENKRKLRKGLPPLPLIKKKPVVLVPTATPKVTDVKTVPKTTPKPTETKVTDVKIESKPKSLDPVENKGEENKGEENKGEENKGEEEASEKDDDLVAEMGAEEEGEEGVGEGGENEMEEGAGDVAEGVAGAEGASGVAGEVATEKAATEASEEEDEYAGLTPEEREAKEKEEYLWRFKILKKKRPTVSAGMSSIIIPEFNEHDDLTMMKTTYERTVKEISLEGNVSRYRGFLIGGFYAIEFIAKTFLGINMKDFARTQILHMENYDSMLVELGERPYNSWSSRMPVELRLMGMILFQAAVFYIGKMVSDSGSGGTIFEIFAAMAGQPIGPAKSETAKEPAKAAPQKKMKGPSISAADLDALGEE